MNGRNSVKAAEKADEDTEWLESVGLQSVDPLPQFSDAFEVRLQTMEQLISSPISPPQVRLINLPTKDVVLTTLEAYAEHVDAVQHIMHVDRTREVVDKVYHRIEMRQHVDPGVLAFVLSLCANVAYYWTIGFHRGSSLFTDNETASKVSSEWARQAFLALEQARTASSTTSIEAIQASILLVFLFYHIEGFNFRVRMMHGTAITMARDLGLHKTDWPGFQRSEPLRQEIIDLEVKRKLWWHLSCTDWLLSFISGPQVGMYCIHPSQMRVQVPRNITRDDLNTREPDFQRSLDEPTVTSYYLQRIKLATTCREVADAMSQYPDPEQMGIDLIKSLDAKFEQQIQEFPRFLRFNIPCQQLKAEYGNAYRQQMDIQGPMINFMLHTRRCKLHLPFLVRAKTNPRFEFARRIGLQAARTVFDIRRFVHEDGNFIAMGHFKLGGMIQHVFYATVVLVMDLCVNRDEEYERRTEEVREALQVIEDAKKDTPRGVQFYDSLMTVLRKHHVKLPASKPAKTALMALDGSSDDMRTDQINHATNVNTISMEPRDGRYGTEPVTASTDQNLPSTLKGGMWHDFLLQGPMLDAADWDALFSDLDSSMI